MAKKVKKTTKKTVKKIADKAATKTIEAPPSIAELLGIATAIKIVKVPENMIISRDKLFTSTIKLAKRISNGLGGEAKKAEREAKIKVKAEAKIKRDKAKNDKKLAKITKLREQLAALEAPTTDGK